MRKYIAILCSWCLLVFQVHAADSSSTSTSTTGFQSTISSDGRNLADYYGLKVAESLATYNALNACSPVASTQAASYDMFKNAQMYQKFSDDIEVLKNAMTTQSILDSQLNGCNDEQLNQLVKLQQLKQAALNTATQHKERLLTLAAMLEAAANQAAYEDSSRDVAIDGAQKTIKGGILMASGGLLKFLLGLFLLACGLIDITHILSFPAGVAEIALGRMLMNSGTKMIHDGIIGQKKGEHALQVAKKSSTMVCQYAGCYVDEYAYKYETPVPACSADKRKTTTTTSFINSQKINNLFMKFIANAFAEDSAVKSASTTNSAVDSYISETQDAINKRNQTMSIMPETRKEMYQKAASEATAASAAAKNVEAQLQREVDQINTRIAEIQANLASNDNAKKDDAGACRLSSKVDASIATPCYKMSNGAFTLDKTCACKQDNSCGTFSLGGSLNIGTSSLSTSVSSLSNDTLKTSAELANLAAAGQGESKNAIDLRNKLIENNAKMKSELSSLRNRIGTKEDQGTQDVNKFLNMNRGIMGASSSKGVNADAQAATDANKEKDANADKSTKNNNGQEQGSGASMNSALDAFNRQGNAGVGLDSSNLGTTGSDDEKTLAENIQNAIKENKLDSDSTFSTKANANSADKRGINQDAQSSIWKQVSKRYMRTAYPQLLNAK